MLRIPLLPEGFFGRDLAEVALRYIRGYEFIDSDVIEIYNCIDFIASLKATLKILESYGISRVSLPSSNDIKTEREIANALGAQMNNTLSIIDRFTQIMESNKCKPHNYLLKGRKGDGLIVPQLFKLNYYEYGKSFLCKPDKSLIKPFRFDGHFIVLGLLGAMLSDIGIYRVGKQIMRLYILLPRSAMGLSQDNIELERKRHQILRNVIYRYREAPRVLLLIKLVSELILNNLIETEEVLGKIASIQEGRRATLLNMEYLGTSGLVELIHNVENLAKRLSILIDLWSRGEEFTYRRILRHNPAKFVEKLTEWLFNYASSCSEDWLYGCISIVDRVSSSKELIAQLLSLYKKIYEGASEGDLLTFLDKLSNNLAQLIAKCPVKRVIE